MEDRIADRRVEPVVRDDGVRDVLGEIDVDRPFPARVGEVERLLDHPGDLVRVVQDVRLFRDRHEHPDDVAFLERVGPDHGGGDLPRDGDDRDGVHVGVRDPGHQVGGSRSGGGDAYPRLPRGPRHPLGGERRGLFVADHDVPELGELGELVVHRHDRPPGVAEQVGHSLLHEGPAQKLRAGDLLLPFRHVRAPLSSFPSR